MAHCSVVSYCPSNNTSRCPILSFRCGNCTSGFHSNDPAAIDVAKLSSACFSSKRPRSCFSFHRPCGEAWHRNRNCALLGSDKGGPDVGQSAEHTSGRRESTTSAHRVGNNTERQHDHAVMR